MWVNTARISWLSRVILDKYVNVSKSSKTELIMKYTRTFVIVNYLLRSLYNGSGIFAPLEILLELKFWNPK